MTWMIADTDLLLDEVGNATTGPERTTKAEGFGALLEQGLKLCELGRTEQRRATGWRMSSQSLRSPKRGAFEPLADSSLGHPQGISNVRLTPSRAVQVPGTQAATFVPPRGRFRLWCVHAEDHSISRPTTIRSLCADQ